MRHTIFRDGVVAGVLGATAVAIWFFIVDLIAGHMLATPGGLGKGLLNLFGPGLGDRLGVAVFAYTVFHYLAFILVGLLASLIVHWAEKQPSVLAGAFILFVSVEIGFYAWSSILSPFLGALSWVQVSVGNLIAAVVMGFYLWKSHPALGHELDMALSGEDAT
jgi:hypothetical protein